MQQGEYGPGIQKAIALLIQYGELFDAQKLVSVAHCHISPDIPNALLEKYTEGVNRIKPICSLHPCLYPEEAERIIGRKITDQDCMADGYVTLDPEEYTFRMELFKKLGFLPTSTCVPYLIGLVPRPNDIVAWTGSGGQVTSNSVFAAKANRDGHSSALASAVTGKTPDISLIRRENRNAQVVFRVEELDTQKFNIGDYGALGYYIGLTAGTRNAAIDGLSDDMTLEQCKYLLSPLPVSGGCTLCHIIGLTPEAPTLAQALGGKQAEETITVRKNDIEDIYHKLTTAKSNQVDLVVFGCPHLTIQEIKKVALALADKTIHVEEAPAPETIRLEHGGYPGFWFPRDIAISLQKDVEELQELRKLLKLTDQQLAVKVERLALQREIADTNKQAATTAKNALSKAVKLRREAEEDRDSFFAGKPWFWLTIGVAAGIITSVVLVTQTKD